MLTIVGLKIGLRDAIISHLWPPGDPRGSVAGALHRDDFHAAGRRAGGCRPRSFPSEPRQRRLRLQGATAAVAARRPSRALRVEVGFGKSAVVEAGGLAFTAAETGGKQWAICLDPLTGATKWKRLLLAKPNRHFERGPVTSPVIDGDRVYFVPYAVDKDVWDMKCPIVCLRSNGTELWRIDKSVWATEASTPLVAGDTLYAGADNPEHVVLVAADKLTGKLRWSVRALPEHDRELGAPASLTYQVVEGIPQVIVATYGTREVLGVHAATGEIMWRYPYPADILIGLVSTPVAVGSRLFLAAGEGKGLNFSVCLQMRAVGGKIAFREAYLSTDLQTNMFHTVSIFQDAVFGFAGGSKAGFLHSTNLEDGRLLWKEEGPDWTKDQNMVIADGLIFALTKSDELVMAEASRQGYHELGRVHRASSWAGSNNRRSPTAGCICAATPGSSATGSRNRGFVALRPDRAVAPWTPSGWMGSHDTTQRPSETGGTALRLW